MDDTVAADHVVLATDCMDQLAHVPDGSARLLFCDPPYNLHKSFGNNMDGRWSSPAAYAAWVLERIDRALPKLTADASVMIMGHPRHSAYLIPGLDARKLHYTNHIIYHYTAGKPERSQFARRHEVILYYRRRSDNCYFNIEPVRVEPVRRDPGSHPDGANPGDVWQIHSVRWNSRERVRGPDGRIAHATQKPLRLLRRLLLAATAPGDIILDPFAGTGTAAVAAMQLGRRSYSIELNAEYAAIARRRLRETLALGQPVPPELR